MKTSDLLKKRVYALTTDFFIVVLSNYFFMASFINFIKAVFFHFPIRAQLFFIQKLGMMSSVSLLSLTFSYFTIFYFVTNGQTMGKMLFSLRVVSPNGEISLPEAMKRSMAYLTCATLGSIFFALSFIRKDEKSLADLFSNTTVIYDKINEITSVEKGTAFQLELMSAIENHVEVDAEENKAA
jgi:uncharacterized RDD family membrane protein YckC